ncbi:RNA-directed DNA polymerase from mobile element jockey [Trichonephila clavipes]|nr:RNA-directed DNA polymerase from mobile element jockey [Trichonephila clavipes]
MSHSIRSVRVDWNDRTHSARGWGGTAILSLKDLFPTIMFPPFLTGVEATLIAFTPIGCLEPFLVVSSYIPPDSIYRKLVADLDSIFKIFKRPSWLVILMLNTPHGTALAVTPESWKTAVVPILKPGKKPTLAESYRPISLLPVLSKLVEKVILARLNDHLERENILIPEQHGFHPRLSTFHQLLRVVEFIKEGNNRDQCTAVVFLGIQKAFDRVWHTGLLFKLITYKLILLINSYISVRSFTVKINRTYSQNKQINAGIAQVSIIGPVI